MISDYIAICIINLLLWLNKNLKTHINCSLKRGAEYVKYTGGIKTTCKLKTGNVEAQK